MRSDILRAGHGRGDGSLTGDKDCAHHKHHHTVPGWRRERSSKRLHPFSQFDRLVASTSVQHSPIPESTFREDPPVEGLLRIVAAFTIDSITEDSIQPASSMSTISAADLIARIRDGQRNAYAIDVLPAINRGIGRAQSICAA